MAKSAEPSLGLVFCAIVNIARTAKYVDGYVTEIHVINYGSSVSV